MIRKITIACLTSILLWSCTGEQKEKSNALTDSITATPSASGKLEDSLYTDSLTFVEEALGDLDKDGQEEKVVIYNTRITSGIGAEREVHIFKKEGASWKLWHKNSSIVLPSESGGMMGDPFQGVSIEKSCIVIYHYGGGGRDKWSYTHRYRYQNQNWYLIGATVIYGSPCDRFISFDYNLSSGNIATEKTTEECNEETDDVKSTVDKHSHSIKPDQLPLMDNFSPGDTEVKLEEGTYYY